MNYNPLNKYESILLTNGTKREGCFCCGCFFNSRMLINECGRSLQSWKITILPTITEKIGWSRQYKRLLNQKALFAALPIFTQLPSSSIIFSREAKMHLNTSKSDLLICHQTSLLAGFRMSVNGNYQLLRPEIICLLIFLTPRKDSIGKPANLVSSTFKISLNLITSHHLHHCTLVQTTIISYLDYLQ